MRVVINNTTGKVLIASAEIDPINQDAKIGMAYLVAERESRIPIGIIELRELETHEIVAVFKQNTPGLETTFKVEVDDRMDIETLDEGVLKLANTENIVRAANTLKDLLEKLKWRWQSARLFAIAVAINSIGFHLTIQTGYIEILQGSFVLNWLIAIFLLFKKTPYEK